MKKFSLKTKRSSRRSSSEKDFKKLFIWLGVVILLFFGARSLVGAVSSFVTTPFFSISHYIDTSAATVPVFIRSREELLTQIKGLEQEILSIQGMSDSLSLMEEENESLRLLLNASSSPRIAAGVIARPPQTPYDVVVLDKGSKDGIIEDAPVYYAEKKVLGYVSKAFSGHSLVTLLSSPNLETSVYLFGPDVFITSYGQGGGVIKVSAPQGLLLEEGNLVVTPSIEGGVLGSIERIESNPREPEQHAFLTYDIPLNSIRIVSVGTDPIQKVSFEEAQQAVIEVENESLRFSVPEDISTELDTDSSTPSELETETP